jgi:hypothetical protein
MSDDARSQYIRTRYAAIHQDRQRALESYDSSCKFWRKFSEVDRASTDADTPGPPPTEEATEHVLHQRRPVTSNRDLAKALRSFAYPVERATKSLLEAMSRCDQRESNLDAMANDPLILLRQTPGLPLTTYHSHDTPCGLVTGRGRSIANFETMLEGEVRVRNRWLRRCHACRWPSPAAIAS